MTFDEQPGKHPSEFLEFVTTSHATNGKDEGIDYHGDLLREAYSTGGDAGGFSRLPAAETDHAVVRRLSQDIPNLAALVEDSKTAAKAEHQMTFLEGLRLYPKAIAWSALISLTIVQEGYDLSIINSFFAFPQFVKRYGERLPNGTYQVSTTWQSALTNGGVAGEIIGLFFNGLLTDRFGYRKTLIGALAALAAFIFLAFFADRIEMLMASEVLCGLSWGVFQTLCTTYAAEVMPVALRGYLTANVNLCWLFGQLIGNSVLRGCRPFHSEWSYRIPFAMQWVWAVPILIGVTFAPESPWWYVRQGRPDDARRSLKRLTSKIDDKKLEETIAMMTYTNAVEKQLSAGVAYWDCFKGTDLRRTEIACVVWITQVFCGAAMIGYAVYFFEQVGFPPNRAFDLTMGMYGLAILGGMLAWVWMRYVGRRTLYLWGCGLCTTIMLVSGILGTQENLAGASWALGGLLICFTVVYDSTIGPVCYALVAEIASTRLRVKTVAIARISYNLMSVVANLLMPRMLNPTAWDWKGKACFFWAGTCSLCWLWCYFRLPEPKGLTYLELDILFEKKASARKFRHFKDVLSSTGYFSIGQATGNDQWHGNVNPHSPQDIKPLHQSSFSDGEKSAKF